MHWQHGTSVDGYQTPCCITGEERLLNLRDFTTWVYQHPQLHPQKLYKELFGGIFGLRPLTASFHTGKGRSSEGGMNRIMIYPSYSSACQRSSSANVSEAAVSDLYSPFLSDRWKTSYLEEDGQPPSLFQ
jgi:hypothetical protein